MGAAVVEKQNSDLSKTTEDQNIITLKQLETTVERNTDRLTEVRRDQLNYKIEKDLLKEVYSSNLQMINIVITIVLGVFAVLGYLGLKSINELRIEFREELADLRLTKTNMERDYEQFSERQRQAVVQVEAVNDRQEDRLKFLEFQEIAEILIVQGQHAEAIEYVSTGLKLEPNNLRFREQFAYCALELKSLNEAVIAWEQVLEVLPVHGTAFANLAELYVLTGKVEKSVEILNNKGEYLVAYGDIFAWYLKCLFAFAQDDIDKLSELIGSQVSELPDDSWMSFDEWGYSQVKTAFDLTSEDLKTRLFQNVIKVLSGESTISELKSLLVSETTP